MTAVQLAFPDCDPGWTDEPGDHQPANRTPSPFDCRQHEIRDLGGQGAGPYALWTVETVPTQEKYL